ncbi:MAG TPA: tRNA uridine-5-carboxymethylaminomethyl(34) synthesis GTPase MnmE [Woeseiaceae bacterium]|nr:tRNA uridine-5-carboxymethylaminomethyl(34) synthesis GTPase MnmE [Woeseiaceae bacterium]
MGALTDTIVAAATPPGAGGVGIVRISGPGVREFAPSLIGSLPPPRVASLRVLSAADGTGIDHGIALYFPQPASFTGEDVLELHAHGGPIVLAMIIEAAIALGARRAEPGEFSKRAFLNDKLDLVQAEAIADLIASGTRQAARAALRTLSGEFSQALGLLAANLTKLRVHVEAAIDFPEEEIDFLNDRSLLARIEACSVEFENLLRGASAGRVLRDGFQLVIVGKPNAGKSSLMNRLSGTDTAIVTGIAGTTRDILRETVNLDGLSVELVDTAGLREDPGVVEKEGIRRAREAMLQADAVLWLQDATDSQPDPTAADLPGDVPVLVLRNKSDLAGFAPGDSDSVNDVLCISALTGEGLDELRERIKQLAGYRHEGEGAFTARQRHVEALQLAAAHFAAGRAALTDTHAGELLAEELRLAQRALGEITGEMSSDELLGRIFSEFCIGK